MLCSHLQTRRREKRGTMRGGGFRRFWVLWMQFGVWPPLRNGPIAKGNGKVATNEAKIRVRVGQPTRLPTEVKARPICCTLRLIDWGARAAGVLTEVARSVGV